MLSLAKLCFQLIMNHRICGHTNMRREDNQMPTINQLVRNGRTDKVWKSKSPALNKGFNSLKKNQLISLHLKNVVYVLVLVQ